MLTQLAARSNNPALCLEVLNDLKNLLADIPPQGFVKSARKHLEVSTHVFESVHRALLDVAADVKGSQAVRLRCVELLLGMAVSTSSLSFFLSVLHQLLFPIAPVHKISALSMLHKLSNMRREGAIV